MKPKAEHSAHRFSVAPMMDGYDNLKKSNAYGPSCAQRVQ